MRTSFPLPLRLACGCEFARRSVQMCAALEALMHAQSQLEELQNAPLQVVSNDVFMAHFAADGVDLFALEALFDGYRRMRARGIKVRWGSMEDA